MRTRAGVALISTFSFLAGCGSSSRTLPVVNAQTTYSNASIEGLYSINLSGVTSAAGIDPTNPIGITGTSAQLASFIGSLKADGDGHMSGALQEFGANANSVSVCTVTFTGTYNLQNSPSGLVTLMVASKGTDGTSNANCTWSGPVQFLLQAGLYGQSLHLAEADGRGLITGVATRQ
jgi:hypothetical protein